MHLKSNHRQNYSFKASFLNKASMEQQTTTTIRGGSNDDELKDCGEAVAGLFGNLRIPASLVAGASLGSAFAMPLNASDGLKLGMVKRIYALLMMGSLASMLLVVLVATVTMNDIVICPTRRSKSVGDYIEENYAMEWLATKINFIWGNVAFVVGASLRGWMAISCAVISKGVLGIMTSLLLVAISVFLEKEKNRTGMNLLEQWSQAMKIVGNRMKGNPLFGVAVIMWVSTVGYIFAEIPHIYQFLLR
jgi:hypothetical protein